MKIFITKSNPNVHFIFKVLFFLKKYICKDELLHYVDMVWKYDGVKE